MILQRSLAVLLVAATAACGTGSTLPDSDADVAGTVARIMESPASLDAPSAILVEQPEPSTHNQIIVHVGPLTPVFIYERGVPRPATRGELAVGDQLQVWTSGGEMRSYPAQVGAERVHVFR